jgi:hypothetical protein
MIGELRRPGNCALGGFGPVGGDDNLHGGQGVFQQTSSRGSALTANQPYRDLKSDTARPAGTTSWACAKGWKLSPWSPWSPSPPIMTLAHRSVKPLLDRGPCGRDRVPLGPAPSMPAQPAWATNAAGE